MADFTAQLTDTLRIEITEREDASLAPVFVLLVGQYDFYLEPVYDKGQGQWRVEVNLADEEHGLFVYQDGVISPVA